ncbi:MAG: hypothetical protein KDK63_04035, partial [Chlamydiia bacterium]|nr:hypothetical protein [Chlamydiia bacterium]
MATSLSSQILVTTYNQNGGQGNGLSNNQETLRQELGKKAEDSIEGLGPYPNPQNYRVPYLQNQVMLVQEMATGWFEDQNWNYIGSEGGEGIAWDASRFTYASHGVGIPTGGSFRAPYVDLIDSQ